MLTFWGQISETIIDEYVASLILPPYLSHLVRQPFQWETHPPFATGREPLEILFTGIGRLEEFALKPEEHALGLLKHALPNLNENGVHFSEDGPAWERFSPAVTHIGSHHEKPQTFLRLFFESSMPIPPRGDNLAFDSHDAYVSLSRQEIFVSKKALTRYLSAWCQTIAPNLAHENTQPELSVMGGGFSFQVSLPRHESKLGGEFLIEKDAIFDDLLQFVGLQRALNELKSLAYLNIDDTETEISPNGVRWSLLSVQI